MPMDRFLVAPINTGLQTDLRPWQIMDDAFELLKNAYVFRGRVRKRFGSMVMGTTGSQLNSRLRISLGNNTNAAMALPANTAAHTPQLAIGQMFSLGSEIFTVYQLGAGVATLTTSAGGAVTAVIDSAAGPNTITFTGGAASPVFWYPALPVMGLTQYESGAINDHPSYAFDTEFAYVFAGGAWVRSGTAVWNGSNAKYFWATNWQGSLTAASTPPVMFVTNFNATVAPASPPVTDDPIWTFDGTTWTPRLGSTVDGFFFLPTIGAARVTAQFVQSARIILPFKDRLLLLNTVENANAGGVGVGITTAHPNRCRFSWNGSPLALNAWYEPGTSDSTGIASGRAAGGDYTDATTDEQIVSAEFIKDRLIVYFERSTWEIVWTGNEQSPFRWQKINTELGSQSTFSTIAFDKDVLTIGGTGVHQCNGSNVQRIDTSIPDYIFDEFDVTSTSVARTCGIRDYVTEMVYWAYNQSNEILTQKFPNQLLAYNYKNKSWAVFDDTVTCFGYFEQYSGLTWASSFPAIWASYSGTWSSSLQQNQRQILMGTPEGFVLILSEDSNNNAPALQITNMAVAATGIVTITAIDHNLEAASPPGSVDNDFIFISNVAGDATLAAYFGNGIIFPVNSVTSKDVFTINTFGGLVAGTYTGGGTISRVSNIQIKTKQFNPYDKQDRNVHIAKVSFAVVKTEAGEITVDYFPSSTQVSMIQGAQASGAIMGTSILETKPYPAAYYPLEQYQDRLWHPVYFQASGECIQLLMYFTSNQMINPNIAFSDFELEGFILYTQPTDSRME